MRTWWAILTMPVSYSSFSAGCAIRNAGRALMRRQDRQAWTELRPDLLGTVTAVHEGGEMTTAAYFTSEKDAHEGEAKEIPEELTRDMEEINSLTVGEPEFLDIKEPWLDSAKR
jgi:hypothetical protein